MALVICRVFFTLRMRRRRSSTFAIALLGRLRRRVLLILQISEERSLVIFHRIRKPLPFEKQVAILYAGTQGLLDDVEVKDLRAFEDGLYPYLESSTPTILTDISTKKALDDTLRKQLTDAINAYKQDFLAARKEAAVAGAKA